MGVGKVVDGDSAAKRERMGKASMMPWESGIQDTAVVSGVYSMK